MTQGQKIDDNEMILRRISERVPSAKGRHFKLRKDINETGVSCSRQLLLPPAELLKDAPADAWVSHASAGEIRKLGLDVVIVDVEGSPGHCEIQSGTANLDDPLVRDDLAGLFKKV